MLTSDNVKTPMQLMREQFMDNVELDPSQRKALQEHREHMESKKMADDNAYMFEAAEKRREASRKLTRFSETLRENLLQECFNITFDEIMKKERCSQHESAIGHSMLAKLIQEEGVSNLLMRFENKNIYLSEFARYTEKYYKTVMEAAKEKCKENPDDDSCFTMDSTIAKNFIDDIKDLVPERITEIIRNRVEDAMQTFVDQNSENKMAIKDIYMNAKLAVNKAAGNDEVKTESAIMAKGMANRVYDRPTNVFNAMVNCIGASVRRTPALQEQYMNESSQIDYGHLCNDARVMYTVLEMANTLGIVDVNESYIQRMIAELKEE